MAFRGASYRRSYGWKKIMALERFKSFPLPNPPASFPPDVQEYLRQFIRALNLYFDLIDSQAPNIAESYRATDAIYMQDSAGVYWKYVLDANGEMTFEPQRDYNTAFAVGFSTGFQ